MNKSILRRLVGFLLALLAYIAVLCLLVFVESRDPGASINSFGQALWYSIVTLSTVGYGDLYPVTPMGKMIGVLFVLLSLGLLALLLSAVVSMLTDNMLPKLRLRLQRQKQWYIFSQCNNSTLALARDLVATEPDCCLLFPTADRDRLPNDLPCLCYPASMAYIARQKAEKCALFFMSEESGSNYSHALEHTALGHPIYCRTEHIQEQLPDHLTLFDRYTCCATAYWRNFPLRAEETNILLIGDGKYAERLLEAGLLTNVFGAGRNINYHVFGQWQCFQNNHPQLDLTISRNQQVSGRDCLFFHTDPWNADAALLLSAHRIILCSDQDNENLSVLRQLRLYFPITASLHLRSEIQIPGADTFGINQQIYTRQIIMRTQLTATAQLLHRVYQAGSSGSTPDWASLSEFAKRSNICAAEHLLVKVRILLNDESITELTPQICAQAHQMYQQSTPEQKAAYRRLEHLRWVRLHSMYNWRYAPVRDNALRHHPALRTFDELPPAQQEKDDYAWQILAAFADMH